MESPSWTLVFVVFGFVISVCALVVESGSQDAATLNASPSPVDHPPKSHSSPPPPPPPPPSPPPPSPSPPPPPPPPPPSSSPSPSPLPPPPPPPSSSPPPPPPRSSQKELNSESSRSPHRKSGNLHDSKKHPPPPAKHQKINAGKKIGLLFAGIAVILQIGVVGFLVFKRRQLLKLGAISELKSILLWSASQWWV